MISKILFLLIGLIGFDLIDFDFDFDFLDGCFAIILIF